MKTLSLISLCLLIAGPATAQPEMKWHPMKAMSSVMGVGSVDYSGATPEEMVKRVNTFLAQKMSTDQSCVYSDASLAAGDYRMCWHQTEGQRTYYRSDTNLLFTAGLDNPDEDKQGYDFEITLIFKKDKYKIQLFYRNPPHNVEFIKDKDGDDDPANKKYYDRFVAQYNVMITTLIDVVEGKAAATIENHEAPKTDAPVRKRLN